LLAVACVSVALAGNIIKEPAPGLPSNLAVFLEYFLPTVLFVVVMLNRTAILEMVLSFIEYLFVPILKLVTWVNRGIGDLIERITSQEFVFFTRGDNLPNLNRVLLYIKNNEHTKRIKIVHVYTHEDEETLEKLRLDIQFLDREYADIDIELVEISGEFTPDLIQELSRKWDIPVNFMFIGSPGDRFPYRIEELGGVRLII